MSDLILDGDLIMDGDTVPADRDEASANVRDDTYYCPHCRENVEIEGVSADCEDEAQAVTCPDCKTLFAAWIEQQPQYYAAPIEGSAE